MSSTTEVGPPVASPVPPVIAVSPGQLAWLDHQLPQWVAAGLVAPESAAVIRHRYVPVRRFSVARLVLTLGACFVGAGIIWLVASNLDQLSPILRFIVVAAFWLGLMGLAEVLAGRRERAGDVASPVVGAARLLAALSFGAVVFQAAQSLQVPAYEPLLVGVWGLGALLYAYAVRGLAPLVVGILLGTFWVAWQLMDGQEGAFTFSTALLSMALAGTAIGGLHAARWWPEFAIPWREVGAALALVGLFVAALPFAWGEVHGSPLLYAVITVAVLLAVAAAVLGDRLERIQVALMAVALAAGIGLASWQIVPADGTDALANPTGESYARAVVAVLVFLAVAVGVAVLGAWRDSDRLTLLATGALVIFITWQAFAVFAPILSGATLFLAVGVVLLVSGVLADRGRRRLVAEAKEAQS